MPIPTLVRHEGTIAYQKCCELMEIAREVIEQFPPGFAFLADQLRRNTTSAANNFAEGYYFRSKNQQRRYFEYSIQSAREASASLDAARAFGVANVLLIERGKRLALEIVKIISKFHR